MRVRTADLGRTAIGLLHERRAEYGKEFCGTWDVVDCV